MSRFEEYKRQFAWRDWRIILDALPSLEGQTVLDLGCGIGDMAASLVARGAHVIGLDLNVIGLDLNEELIQEARSRGLANAVSRRSTSVRFRTSKSRSTVSGAVSRRRISGNFPRC